ncbi:MAG TPA: cyanophycinase [Longimicrobiaceae bacterium]|nr:cyanophycinase [Longimicrobiaceae bacterium]
MAERAKGATREKRDGSAAEMKRNGRRGHLLVIGGAEDPDEDRMEILPRLVEMAGGKRAKVVICSAPSEDPEEKVRVYGDLFEKIGVREVTGAPIKSRAEAEHESLRKAVEGATAVFFTGGDQLRLTSLMAGSHFCESIRERLYDDHLVVAGTSAGAAALSSVMIIGGRNEGTVRRRDVKLAPGLGYWRDVVVDTHFNQRGRVNRLLAISAQNPQVLGIGLDENTAVDCVPGQGFTVLGAGVVTVFNGRITHTNAAMVGEEGMLAVTDSTLHVLPAGYRFDLQTRRPMLPDGTVIEKAPPS